VTLKHAAAGPEAAMENDEMMRTFVLVGGVMLAAVALTTVSCQDSDADATTGASPGMSGKKYALPPAGETYTVMGEVDGLAAYAIKYDDRLYRGGQLTSQAGLDALKKWGVATIVTITPTEDERKYVKEAGIKLVELPFEKTKLTDKDLTEFLAAVKASEGPVYVHCHGGTHRAGALCLAYRLATDGWDYNKAAVEFGRLGGDLKADHPMLDVIEKYKAPAPE